MIRSLQSLRFVFVTLIILSHVYGAAFDYGGDCGVAFFFLLSGFVLSVAYHQKVSDGQFKTTSFVARQLMKFYPLHLVTLAFFVVMMLFHRNEVDFGKLIPNILLLQSWIPLPDYHFSFNAVSWFLCNILFLYLLFKPACRLISMATASQVGVAVLLVFSVYLGFVMSVPEPHANSILYVFPLCRIPDFLLGIILYQFYASEQGLRLRTWLQNRSTIQLTLLEGGLIVWMIASYFVYGNIPLQMRCVCMFWLFLPPVILFFAMTEQHAGLLGRLLHSSFLCWLGNISLELFMLQIIGIRLARSIGGMLHIPSHTAPVIVILTFLIIFVLAVPAKKIMDKIYSNLRKNVYKI